MSELIDRGDVLGVISCFFEDSFIEDADVHCAELEREINRLPAAPRWHRVENELPERKDAVNVVWVNRNPESYYADIKDKPFVATAHYHNGKWYWFSATCNDYLDEYGRCEVDEVDEGIDILYWMPLPEPPINRKFT